MSEIEQQDQHWMRLALKQAQRAMELGEVPVGAVVVCNNQCIAAAHNTPITEHDPTAHAEVNALRLAAKALQNYRLEDCTVYITLEPCAMCAMAMLHARVKRIVYAAPDPKTGAAGSVMNLFDHQQINHQTKVTSGVLEQECSDLLKAFFSGKRLTQKEQKVRLRDDALRTPEDRFAQQGIPEGEYTNALPALSGLRLHYHLLSSFSNSAASSLFLLLHESQAYSEQYRKWISENTFQDVFHTCLLIPDLIGFGRSDKPKKQEVHTPYFHAQVLYELLCELQFDLDIGLVLPISQLPLALALQEIFKDKRRFDFHLDFHFVRELPLLDEDVRSLPYLDRGYYAGPDAFKRWEKLLYQGQQEQQEIHIFRVYDNLAICFEEAIRKNGG